MEEWEKKVKEFYKKQIAGYRVCPKCGFKMRENLMENARDRITKKLYLCSDCGLRQALDDFLQSKGVVKENKTWWFFQNDVWKEVSKDDSKTGI